MAPSKREMRRASITSDPSSAASAPFPYNSIARPPTGYSSAPSISGFSPPPPLPAQHGLHGVSRQQHVRRVSTDGLLVNAGAEDDDSDGTDNTPLYARSDWTKGDQPSARSPQRQTAYTESEYPLTTTALPIQGDGMETPSYAQRQWGDQDHRRESSASVITGEIAGGLISARDNTGEVDDERNRTGHGAQGLEDDEGKWAEAHTAWSKSSYAPRGTILETVYEDRRSLEGHPARQGAEGYRDAIPTPSAELLHREYADSPISITHRAPQIPSPINTSSSTRNPLHKRASSLFEQKPLSASTTTNGLHHRGASNHQTRKTDRDTRAVLTPRGLHKLGRMSVAPARYTLPPTQHIRRPSDISETGTAPLSDGSNPYAPPGGLRFQQNLAPSVARPGKSGLRGLGKSLAPLRPDGMLSRMKITKVGQVYMTYRPFITPVLLLMSAMVLTLALQSKGTLGTLVKVEHGGFGGKIGAGTSGPFGLGVGGWCQLETKDPICKTYRKADFVASSHSFQIPGPDSVQVTLNYLLAALTGFTWLLGVYHLTIAFLHFFLLFGLSIPWDFFITSGPLPPLTGLPSGVQRTVAPAVLLSDDEVVQKEVDMRVRCERPPYEAYGWVWWAWWAHRRGPVGHILAALIGMLCLCATGTSAGFYLQVRNAVADNKAALATGTLVPVICFVLSADPILSAMRYLLHARYNIETFNAPPSPTPAAILLPPNTRPMRHIRNTGAASYFATQEEPLQVDTLFAVDPHAPPLPPLPTSYTPHPPIDPETVRWLAAYPLDPDLVSLIADLRAGKESEDFVLSDVGLLYLRPDPDAEDGASDALLVPPAGQIRSELLQDAHFEVVDSGDEGGSAHWGPETMLTKMGETFWWPGIEEDCRNLVQGCTRCMRDGLEVDVEVEEMQEVELIPGLTPLAYTGIKTSGGMTALMTGGGKSAVAADMAYKMSKAQDEARREALSA